MKYIECLRVPKVGELARLRQRGCGSGWAIFRVTRVSDAFLRVEGICVEADERAVEHLGWRVGGLFIVNWGEQEEHWEYHRLVPDEEAS